ncbi:uncharacterized protein LOC114874007, partial [Osmia bicornis bicornis]|uniref:uncharacterized protein LOC114874007 n=1 Tax=Osmia bicornis bicornis TaxID=1437191 RepID=UPI001EAF35C9
MELKVRTWSPTVSGKVPDNIVSSQFSSHKVFIPSYEREKRPCIEQLLTNEYQRMWWQEKQAWDKRFTTPTKKATMKLLQHKIIKMKPTIATIEKTTPVEKPTSVLKSKAIKKLKKKKEATAVKTGEKEKNALKQEKETQQKVE